MKQVRPLGRVTAGPESKILEGGSVLEERVAGDGEASRPYSAAGDGRDMPYEYKVGETAVLFEFKCHSCEKNLFIIKIRHNYHIFSRIYHHS